MFGIDLHLHLDGAMPLPLIRELAKERDLIPKGKRVEDLVQAGAGCSNLQEFLNCFKLMEELLKEPAALERCAYELVRTLAGQGLGYAEIRFNPFLFTSEKMKEDEAVESVLRGMYRGSREESFKCGAILCALVHASDEENRRVLELAKEYRSKGVVGFDLAGPEGLVPMEHFRPLFREAADASIPFTIHAGECGDPDNIKTAVSFGAKRIGHGTAAIQSRETMNLLRREGVTLEVCVTSNVQTHAVNSLAEHPIRRFFDEGIRVTFNTDDMTVSGITLQSEADLLMREFGFDSGELEQMEKYALEAAFASDL